MVNPDNFIFHSDFWYPTGYLSGTKEYNNVSIPADFELSDQYTEGAYYSVFIEYPDNGGGNTIGERFIGDTIIPHTVGNKLMAFKGAQSAGATFTGKLHWRIYPKSETFNFLSSGRLEQTAKTLDGFYATEYATNVHNVILPTGLTGKYFIRGVTQIEGRGAEIIGGAGGTGWYNVSTGTVRLDFVTYPEILPVGTKIYYKIQLVPVTPEDVFVFNSQKYSFSIPKMVRPTITTAATMGANAENIIYGDWVDIPGNKTAYDLVVKWSGNPTGTSLHLMQDMQFGTNIFATATLESNGAKVRPVLRVNNYANSSQSYPTQTITYGIYFYQNNNSA